MANQMGAIKKTERTAKMVKLYALKYTCMQSLNKAHEIDISYWKGSVSGISK